MRCASRIKGRERGGGLLYGETAARARVRARARACSMAKRSTLQMMLVSSLRSEESRYGLRGHVSAICAGDVHIVPAQQIFRRSPVTCPVTGVPLPARTQDTLPSSMG